jgi:hypothetical protein
LLLLGGVAIGTPLIKLRLVPHRGGAIFTPLSRNGFQSVQISTTAAPTSDNEIDKEPAMSKPTVEQAKMGTEGIAFCIARTLIERDPSLKAPMRANLRKMWELLEEREDHGAADMVDTMIKALNDPAFFKP